MKIVLKVSGMHCVSCENSIEKNVGLCKGVIKVTASYKKSEVSVEYDDTKTSRKDIEKIIFDTGYSIEKNSTSKNTNEQKNHFDFVNFICIAIIIYSLLKIVNNFGLADIFNVFPTASEDMGYIALFVVGLFTSVHCIAMCGGINISQCANVKYTNSNSKTSKIMPSLLYNIGRVISYTTVGFIVGAIGSVFQFSGIMSGFVAIVAGAFMIIMGLNMLNIFPWLRKFNPSLPKVFGKIDKSGKTPFVVGILNGLMPCGPLQAMQLYALSTGSPIKGALAMFFFSLGTLPLMFGLGAVSSILTKTFTNKMMVASGFLVVVLGVSMLNTGLSLSGFNTVGVNASESKIAVVSDDIQTVVIDVSSRGYEAVTVKKGIPVNLVFRAEEGELNSCNYAIKIPKYGIKQELNYGDTVVNFTPNELGKISYSCYMGMIRSSILVVE